MNKYKTRKEFTKEQIKKACELAEMGCIIKTICASIGVSEALFYKLKKEYKKEPQTYNFSKSEKEFVEKVTAAINKCFVILQSKVYESGIEDGKQALEILSRRMPKEFGRKDYLNLKARIKKDNDMTEEELDKLIKEKLEQINVGS